MALGIDPAPSKKTQALFEQGLQLISACCNSSKGEDAAENMAEMLTRCGDSTLQSALTAEASGENDRRVLLA